MGRAVGRTADTCLLAVVDRLSIGGHCIGFWGVECLATRGGMAVYFGLCGGGFLWRLVWGAPLSLA